MLSTDAHKLPSALSIQATVSNLAQYQSLDKKNRSNLAYLPEHLLSQGINIRQQARASEEPPKARTLGSTEDEIKTF
jgi:primosomal protein N''